MLGVSGGMSPGKLGKNMCSEMHSEALLGKIKGDKKKRITHSLSATVDN